jgi:hypothetical protein
MRRRGVWSPSGGVAAGRRALRPRSPATSLILGLGKIGNAHQEVLKIFRNYTEVGRASIDQRASLGGPGSWKKARPGSSVELELLPEVWEVGLRRDNTPTQIVPLRAAQELWASWFERWYVEEPQRLRLDTVSLGIWEGPSGSVQQLFRADWDHCDHSPAAGRPQPHWNIDHEIPAFALPLLPRRLAGAPSTTGSGLEELTPQGGSPLDISRYHLCMSAHWSPQGQRGWRRPHGEDIANLLSWLDLTLDHISQEVGSRTFSPRPLARR